MNPLMVALLLWQYGHAPAIHALTELAAWAMGGGLAEALKSFQEFHALEPTGKLDSATVEKLQRPRCSHKDVMNSSAAPCAWSVSSITYAQALQLTQIPADRAAAIYRMAWQQWADVCGIEPREANHGDLVNVLARSGEGTAEGFDPSGSILAWSQLPCNAAAETQLQQEFNELVNWDEQMLLGVACHEIGHALGLSHLPGEALMNAYYNPRVLKPTAADVAEAQLRYGPPKSKPAPVPAQIPAETGPGEVSISIPVAEAGTYLLTLTMRKQ